MIFSAIKSTDVKMVAATFDLMLQMWLKHNDVNKIRKTIEYMYELQVEPSMKTYAMLLHYWAAKKDLNEIRRYTFICTCLCNFDLFTLTNRKT